MAQIHPTAVVEPGARIADEAVVGPMCHVGAQAVIGRGSRLVSHVVVLGRTTLGEGNTVWPQAVLGAAPQDLKFRGEDSELVIGDRNEIRELATLHLGTANAGGVTRVGSDNLLMVGCHVAHDCVVGDRVIIANNVALAGHVHIEDGVNIGGVAGVHHFVTIGRHAFVGGMTRLVHDAPPFMIIEGNPSEVRGVNVIGLERKGFDAGSIERLKEAYRRLFRGRHGPRGRRQDRNRERAGNDGHGKRLEAADPAGEEAAAASGDARGNMAQRLDALENEWSHDEAIRVLVEFQRRVAASAYGRYRETLRADPRRRPASADKPSAR